MTAVLYVGDVREVLPRLPAGSVRCCVTSPPYFGLRDYAIAGQLGLEPTPDEYVANLVAVFGEVRRVLTDDGTLWLNLGDSYAGGGRGGDPAESAYRKQATNTGSVTGVTKEPGKVPVGCKPKDLVGVPWALATALRDPYYTGRVPKETDRVWLAATLDAEGTICGFDHDRADGGGHRSGVHITITNTSHLMLDEAARIWPTSRSEHQRPYAGHLGTKQSWRWIVHGIDNKLAILRELYAYLIVKRQQAVVAYSLLLLMANAKRLGHSPQKDSTIQKRAVLTALLSGLNQQEPVVMPGWLTEPPSLFEPGWYLRSDIIFAKPNPMPESVTDRPTKSHEYLFLLAKSARYFYNAAAIAEPFADERLGNRGNYRPDYSLGAGRNDAGTKNRAWNESGERIVRNARTVWTIATQPYAGAHFAVFPEELARRCIVAGSAPGDTVLDPFSGSGTTCAVAVGNGRHAIGIDLNPAYHELARQRIGPMLCEVAA